MSIPDDPAYLLNDARQNLIDANREPPGSQRRRSFAHHAETQCADLILNPESSDMQRAQASVFLEQAQAIQKEPDADPPDYQLSTRVAQRRQQRDVERSQGSPSVLDATANHPRHDIPRATNGHAPNTHPRRPSPQPNRPNPLTPVQRPGLSKHLPVAPRMSVRTANVHHRAWSQCDTPPSHPGARTPLDREHRDQASLFQHREERIARAPPATDCLRSYGHKPRVGSESQRSSTDCFFCAPMACSSIASAASRLVGASLSSSSFQPPYRDCGTKPFDVSNPAPSGQWRSAASSCRRDMETRSAQRHRSCSST